ncbi:putative acidocalcisomal exopolyphosphatase [Leptomonas pyrrhocoris]|uniref:Putative acidocalcisomal exopolyphosphatase n=1 Tax=Leptomonas pyrrhocoris TaxID=157538 RepID=A0A0M9FPY3_LEPPY|nr:putative acidocalcisomal exopolyphosphatase [Leptomonas pyrrhocoris]XP_015652119.1 putative acidocalcisomal exopolyphosphatase [Leptomonas pyrrhocoris]KPA73679.1 putative acidocalcisomal exopolyphosphatase [Leptomonas pyrrhocoris]KPA73680.1 putative acidocalcisomal exopolyphosphatase [Leptomonas pyrrhocoris]|eukprot:XP_015652118.1 putative acidocalcisomal exopolyphosphatase [Leptomonas pyrrhocoris]
MASVINEFLRECMSKVASKVRPLTVVQGNEGGDMDSIVGSIYFALLLEKSNRWNVENPVPAINFPPEDLVLRNDVVKLFEEVGIDTSLIMSVQKGQSPDRYIDLAALDAKIYLYDHNKLTSRQEAFDHKVIGILDHHMDEKKHTDFAPRRRLIKAVGSCCTLVTECFNVCERDVPCPELLDAPIILDTVNFDPAQKKVTPEDIAMHQWLCRRIDDEDYDTAAIYNKLAQWKNDVLVLTVAENMRRDYKKFDFPWLGKKGVMVTGTSSVPCSCPEFQEKYTVPQIVAEAVKFIRERQLDVLIFAFAGHVDGKHSREVAFCAKPEIMEVFAPFIEDSSDGIVFSLISESATEDKSYSYASYSLSDPAVSRKKLVPALRKFLAEGGSRSLL